jgi:hypothetical protein
MQFARLSRVLFVVVMSALAFPRPGRAQVDLGDPPTAPRDVSGLPGGVRKQDVTAGFSVNIASREEMRSFYNGVYTASSGLPINSTSVVSNCVPGANAAAYQDAVVRRINWFRAAAGIPASITLDNGDCTNDQAAALMMSANGALSHFPPPSWSCYTSSGANAASNSNLAIGNAGPDAITAYIGDYGANNTEVGHRRWILYPQTQIMGTGDIPAQGNYYSANATWVFDANLFGPRPATAQPFVAWPPPGFIPSQLVFPRWSFALSNADLSTANVIMTSNGVSIPVNYQPYQTGYGENTMVWVPDGLDATSSSTVFPFSGTDIVYSIVVTNIHVGSSTTGFAYTVALFDPSVPGADYVPTAISGPAQIEAGLPASYTCAPPNDPHVTGYQWVRAQAPSGNLFDNAENGASNFIVNISPGYPVTTNGLAAAAGSSYFQLGMPGGTSPPPVRDQILQLNRVLFPATNTLVRFAGLFGYASSNQVAEVQVSTTGGLSWQDIYSLAGTNGPNQPNFPAFTTYSLSLSNYAGQSVLLRFNYHLAPNADGTYILYYGPSNNPPAGWFIDNILITNTLQLTNFSTNATSSTNFVFTPALAESYILQAQPVIFNQFPIGFGPLAQVTAIPPPTTGSLQVTITPASAVSAGAQWQVNGGAFRASGAIVTNLSPTNLTVSFKTIPGWTSPSNQTVTISVGQTATLVASYIEATKPTLAITSPTANQRSSNSTITVTGTATDNVAVASVCYQLNSGSWTTATPGSPNSWTKWTANVTLSPGTNVVQAYSQNPGGNCSPTNKVAFLFIPSATLTVRTNGLGGISPVDNGQLLAIGTNYTLTAAPGNNWIFSNWVAGGSQSFVSNNPVLNFKMQSNLVLQANFVTNFFLAAQGAYHGLFAPASLPRQQTNSGSFTVNVTSSGVLSGSLILGWETNTLSGQFDVSGKAQILSTPPGRNPLTTTLQLNWAGQSVQGTVTDGSFTALLHGDQAVFNSTHKAANYQGQYTLVIAGTNAPAAGPFGTSYGTVTVDPLGNIAFAGSLADGTTSVSQSSVVSKDGYWPFYVPLYGGEGSLWGWNYFTNQTIISAPFTSWINVTNTTQTAVYRSGFTNQHAGLIASFYTSTNNPLLSLTNAQVILEGGGLPFTITNQITLASNNLVTVPKTAENTNGLTLKIAATGLVSGSFQNPSNPKLPINFNGILLQNQTSAAGYFLATNQSGSFMLIPP